MLARLEGRVPAGVRLVGLSGADPAQIMEAWGGATRVFVVDAVLSGAAAGTVRRFDAVAEPLPAAVISRSMSSSPSSASMPASMSISIETGLEP